MKRLALAALFLCPLAQAAEPLRVLASIQPLGQIATAVAGPHARVEVLLPPGQSPHDYALKPSDVRRLQQAEQVLWMGEGLETSLEKPLGQLPAARVMALGAALGIHGEAHHHDHEHEGESQDEQVPAGVEGDLHAWLDPRQAARLAGLVAEVLSQRDPAHASLFHDNAQRFQQQAQALEAELQQRFKPLQGRGFAPTHDGFRHFSERFGVPQRAVLMRSPGVAGGVRHMAALREQIRRGEVVCLVSEAEFPLRAPEQLARETGIHWVELDPLGADRALGEDGYISFIREFGRRLGECLAGGAP